MADLVITATIVAGLFAGALVLAYDMYSSVVWRRQLVSRSEPAQTPPVPASPATDAVADLPAPAAEALSP